jgi:hypothetical protein
MSANLRRRGLVLGNLSPLRGVLREWQNLNEDTIWRKIPDLPWWYNERAVLSQFVGAVWRQPKGWTFEEYSTWRYQTRKKHHTGRADIWFRVNSQDYVGEAKQCWPIISGDALRARQSIESTLDTASREVAEIMTPGYDEVGLAMVFAAPLIIDSKLKYLRSYLADVISEVEKVENVGVAWVFPEYAEKIRLPKGHSSYRYIFPGTWLFLRPVKLH